MNDKYKNIEEIDRGPCNYCGRIWIAEGVNDGLFYWVIENWDDLDFEEIPKSLYDELKKFNKG